MICATAIDQSRRVFENSCRSSVKRTTATHLVKAGEAFLTPPPSADWKESSPKKPNSRYVGGRSRDWIKVKCQRRQEFVIGGYTTLKGNGIISELFTSVSTAIRNQSMISKVGTGFDTKDLEIDLGKNAAAGSSKIAVRRKEPHRSGPPLGGAQAGLRSALLGLDP